MDVIELTDRAACPLCGGQQSVVHIPFPEIPVVRCCKCDFIYSSRLMPASSLASYYENNFGSRRHMQGQIVNSRVNSWAIAKLLDIRDIGNILDIGTGYGFLLKELSSRFKLDATGIELSRQEASYAKSTLGLNVINAPLGESGLKKAHYDLVTSFEVIEHIPEPPAFIDEMAQYVKVGGYLLIMTDNFESHMAKSLGAGFPKWIPHSHISHFSSRTLRKALETTNGLTLVKCFSYTPWEILLRAACYKIRGIKRTPSEAFDLKAALASEMKGQYNLFALRKFINKAWARLSLSQSMDGDLIYFLARKTG